MYSQPLSSRLEKLLLPYILFYYYYAVIIKNMTKVRKEKVGKDTHIKVICEKNQDVGMADEFDDELLITRLRSKFSLYYMCDYVFISGVVFFSVSCYFRCIY